MGINLHLGQQFFHEVSDTNSMHNDQTLRFFNFSVSYLLKHKSSCKTHYKNRYR